MKNLTILFDNLCCHGWTNVYSQAQVSPQCGMVIWILCCFISKHHPFKPLKPTKLAYVRCLSRHSSFMDLTIQFVDAMCSFGPYMRLKFKAVIPKSLWGTRLNELPSRTFFQFLYLSFSSIWPWGEWICLPMVTWCLLAFLIELTKDHFFGIITYYCMWHPILLKGKGQCLKCGTF